MTELAYLADMDAAYVRSFRARVTALPPGGLVLDRTFFYPAGGGQPTDRGRLRAGEGPAVEVVDVVKSGPSVLHRIRGRSETVRSLSVGAEVEGTIDWERRHRHMRLHTGQHLLSARIFVRSGRRTRRAVLGGISATLDLDGPLEDALVPELAADLAEAAALPRPVSIVHIPRAEWEAHPEAERSGLVPLPAQVDPVRVVRVEGLDVCPCGGTHLRSTGELGAVVLEPIRPLPDGSSRVAFTLADGASPSAPG